MPGAIEMNIYLDSCITIYLVESHPSLAIPIQERLLLQEQKVILWTDLTRMEARIKPLRENNLSQLSQYDQFFSARQTRKIEINTPVFDLATEIRATHGLKTPDALHLATAIHATCDEFWTNDFRLAKAAAQRINIVTFN